MEKNKLLIIIIPLQVYSPLSFFETFLIAKPSTTLTYFSVGTETIAKYQLIDCDVDKTRTKLEINYCICNGGSIVPLQFRSCVQK